VLVSSESVFLLMANASASISGSDDSDGSDFGEDDVEEAMVRLLVLSMTYPEPLAPWWRLF